MQQCISQSLCPSRRPTALVQKRQRQKNTQTSGMRDKAAIVEPIFALSPKLESVFANYRVNFLNFTRFGSSASAPSRRFLSSS